MPGARCTRSPCATKMHTVVTTSPPEHPAFPHANGFNGFLRALPGDEFLFVTVAKRIDDVSKPGWADASP